MGRWPWQPVPPVKRCPGAGDAARERCADAAFDDGKQLVDLRDALARLKVPVLVAWGVAAAVIPATHAQEVERTSSGRLEVFADCGHCPHIERADAFNQLTLTFLVG